MRHQRGRLHCGLPVDGEVAADSAAAVADGHSWDLLRTANGVGGSSSAPTSLPSLQQGWSWKLPTQKLSSPLARWKWSYAAAAVVVVAGDKRLPIAGVAGDDGSAGAAGENARLAGSCLLGGANAASTGDDDKVRKATGVRGGGDRWRRPRPYPPP